MDTHIHWYQIMLKHLWVKNLSFYFCTSGEYVIYLVHLTIRLWMVTQKDLFRRSRNWRISRFPLKMALQDLPIQYRRTSFETDLSPCELWNGKQIRARVDVFRPSLSHLTNEVANTQRKHNKWFAIGSPCYLKKFGPHRELILEIRLLHNRSQQWNQIRKYQNHYKNRGHENYKNQKYSFHLRLCPKIRKNLSTAEQATFTEGGVVT